MGKGRTVALIVALALVIALLGGCGSSSKSSSTNAAARTAAAQAKAARAKIAVAKRQLAAAQVHVARQRRELAIAVRRRQLQAQAAAASTTTTLPVVAPPQPITRAPGAPSPPATRPAARAADVLAIGQTINTVNAAFTKGVVAGIAASEAANYYVAAGVYTAGQCSAFEAARGLGVVADHLVVRSGSVVASPGWVDPVLNAIPGGRVYALTMDDIQTQVSTQEQRTQTVSTHAAVQPDGRALLFLRCA